MKSRFAKFVSIILVIVLMTGTLPVRRAVFAAEEESVAETEAETKNDEAKETKGSKENKASESKPSKTAKPAKESEKGDDAEETPATKPSTTVKPAEDNDKASEAGKNTETKPAQTTKPAEETTTVVSEPEASKEEPAPSANADDDKASDDNKVTETEPSQTTEQTEEETSATESSQTTEPVEEPSESDSATGKLPEANVNTPRKNATGTLISQVQVTIEAPQAGARPDYEAAFPTGAQYYCLDTGSASVLNDVSWYDLTTKSNLNPQSGVFQSGHQYQVTVYLTPSKGYYFDENITTGTVNGNRATVSPALNEYHQLDDTERLRVEYVFPKLSGTSTDIITSVNITIDAPAIGKTPDYDPTLPTDARYFCDTNNTGGATINDITWFDMTDRQWLYPGGVFQANHQYQVQFYLTPKSGFTFSSQQMPTVKINGNAADTGDDYLYMSSGQLYCQFTFTKLSGNTSQKISSASVTISAPSAGSTPAYTASLGGASYTLANKNSDNYRNGIKWYDTTSSSAVAVSSSSGVFQGGHKYQVEVYLSPKEGYYFDLYTTATLNNQNAYCQYLDGMLRIVYDFSALPVVNTPIASVGLTMTAPSVGANPAYKATLASGANYTLSSNNSNGFSNGIRWLDGSTAISSTSTFQAGHTYKVEVYLTANSGYAFNSNTKATVNNQTATPSLDGSQLKVTYTFAALPYTTITTVGLTLTAPSIGAKPTYTATLAGTGFALASNNSNGFSGGIRWLDGSTAISSTSTFQAGHSYTVEVYLAPKTNYAFTGNTTATVNNKTATRSMDGSQLKVTYTFATLANTAITTVGLTLTAPSVGAKPAYTATMAASSYSLSSKNTDNFSNGIRWYDVTGSAYINSSSTFQAGHTYKVEVYLAPKTGYAFSSSTKATVNSQTATPSIDGSQLKVTYTFAALPNTSITAAGVTLTAPSVGAKPAYTATLAASSYSLSSKNTDNFSNGIRWYDVTGNAYINSSSTFQAAHSYRVEVYLTPKTGYAFNSSTKATVNGQSATISFDGSQLKVTYAFAALPNTAITSVGLTLTAPAVGSKPAYTATLAASSYALSSKNSDNFSNGIRWLDANTNTYLSSSSTFQAGHSYKVEVYLAPKTGYAFNSSTKATVNSQTATPAIDGSQLKVTYTFAVLPNTAITSVGLTITAPSVGGKPAYTATLSGTGFSLYSKSNDNYSNGIRWWDVTGNTAVNTSSGVFQAGHTYMVEVYLTPATGYAFNSSTKATVNSKSATPSIDGSQLKVAYTFAALPNTAITSVGLTLTAPSIGAKPSYTASLTGTSYALSSKNSDGFINGIRWLDGSTAISSNSTFQAGHSYKVEVYLTALTGYVFNSSTKATVNNQTVTPSVDGSQLKVTYTFQTLSNTAITGVALTVTAPSVSARPVYSAILVNGANYTLSNRNTDNYVNGIRWWDVTSKAAVNSSSGVFQPGHSYIVEVYLTPKTGYAFSNTLTAKVNNQTAKTSIDGGQLKVTYEFQALPNTPITDVAVTITEPLTGRRPAYSATLAGSNYTLSSRNSDNYSKGIRWWDLTTNSAVNSSSGVFQAGHNYKVEIYLTAKSGYCFNGSTTAAINNQPATRSIDGSQLMITYTFVSVVNTGDTIEIGDFMYLVTNDATDGTGTVTLTGVTTQTTAVVIPPVVELNGCQYLVNRIGPRAFYNNKVIKTLSIGANVVVIDAYAFYGCSYLVKVAGGARLRTIGARAFASCIRLRTFVITSRALRKIGAFSFYNDRSLKVLYIRNTVALTKGGVKKSLKGSRVKVVKVKKSKVRKYRKIFKKKNSGRRVKVKR